MNHNVKIFVYDGLVTFDSIRITIFRLRITALDTSDLIDAK